MCLAVPLWTQPVAVLIARGHGTSHSLLPMEDQRSRATAWSSETWALVLALPPTLQANLVILIT